MSNCTHPGCAGVIHARGLCAKHYMKALLIENDDYRERQREASRRWKRKNQPKTQAGAMNRRAKNRRVRGKVTEEHLQHLIKTTTHCIYCGTTLNRANSEFDHLVPFAAGGLNENENIQRICKRCNRAKGELPEGLFIQWLEQVAQRLGFDIHQKTGYTQDK